MLVKPVFHLGSVRYDTISALRCPLVQVLDTSHDIAHILRFYTTISESASNLKILHNYISQIVWTDLIFIRVMVLNLKV